MGLPAARAASIWWTAAGLLKNEGGGGGCPAAANMLARCCGDMSGGSGGNGPACDEEGVGVNVTGGGGTSLDSFELEAPRSSENAAAA